MASKRLSRCAAGSATSGHSAGERLIKMRGKPRTSSARRDAAERFMEFFDLD